MTWLCKAIFSIWIFSFPSFPGRILSPTFYLFSTVSSEPQCSQILDTMLSATWGIQQSKNWKARSSYLSSHKMLWTYMFNSKKNTSVNYLPWLLTTDTKRAFKMMGLRPCDLQMCLSHWVWHSNLKCCYSPVLLAHPVTTYQEMLRHRRIEMNANNSAHK